MVIISENIVIKATEIVATIRELKGIEDTFYRVTVNEYIIFKSAHRDYAQEVYERLVSAIKEDADVFEV